MEINGKVEVRKEYFLKMAKADYRNYRQALWREIFQNSIDAGSTKIIVSWDGGERSITATDNGCGMDLKTLQEGFLSLGGTVKKDGDTGAFGKAKELEAFSWERYELFTGHLILEGAGDQYTITDNNPEFLDGVTITIYIQEDEDFDVLCGYAKNVAEKIEVDCEFIIDGQTVECMRPKGELRKSLDVGDIYVNENAHCGGYYAQVRMNGIWMFESYVGEDIPHTTLELSTDSIATMTSNRDGLKDMALRGANEFFNKLASDRKSALHPDKEMITFRTQGEDGTQIHVSDEDMEFMEARFGTASRDEFLTAFAKYISIQNEDGDIKLAKMRVGGTDRFDYQRLKFFGFRWDAIHKFEKSQEEQAHEFLDGSRANAQRAKTLLTMWGESLKQVLLDIQKYRPFSVGFNWDENQAAECSKKDGEVTFFLNPSVLQKYPLSNKKKLVRKLRQLAMHEVSHLEANSHTEYFMTEFHRIEEASWDSDPMYDRIAKTKG